MRTPPFAPFSTGVFFRTVEPLPWFHSFLPSFFLLRSEPLFVSSTQLFYPHPLLCPKRLSPFHAVSRPLIASFPLLCLATTVHAVLSKTVLFILLAEHAVILLIAISCRRLASIFVSSSSTIASFALYVSFSKDPAVSNRSLQVYMFTALLFLSSFSLVSTRCCDPSGDLCHGHNIVFWVL